jgi:hypothetical protein
MATHPHASMGNRLHFDGCFADFLGIPGGEVFPWCHGERTVPRRSFLLVDVV